MGAGAVRAVVRAAAVGAGVAVVVVQLTLLFKQETCSLSATSLSSFSSLGSLVILGRERQERR